MICPLIIDSEILEVVARPTAARIEAAAIYIKNVDYWRKKMDSIETQVTIADVIDLAINEYLWDGQSDNVKNRDLDFSCNAINAADKSGTTEIKNFLQSMGINPISAKEFRFIPFGPKRQYARALWLTWAAMIAREEGKTL